MIVGLGLDDAPADPVDKEANADQIARDIERRPPEEIGTESGFRTPSPLSDWR
jgi:hypothetical protein